MLHVRTFQGFFCTDCENINIHACGGALDAFIFESNFPHHTRFNAFVSVLSFLVLNLKNSFYCMTQAAKNSIRTYRNEHLLDINLL